MHDEQVQAGHRAQLARRHRRQSGNLTDDLRRTGQATISIHNQENPYEFASIACKLTGDTHEGADDVIDALAKKYMDADSYPFRQEGEQRVTFTLTPGRVTHYGGS